MKTTNTISRIEILEQRVWRIEKLAWYVAGLISIRAGYDIVPFVSALIG